MTGLGRSMGRWFRAYDSAVDDPKLQRLPGETFKLLFNLWCIASQNDGVLPGVEDIAFKLRLEKQRVEILIVKLTEAGLIDTDETGRRPHNWNGRQFKSDVSSNRVKRFRERLETVSETAVKRRRNVSETAVKRRRNVSETASETAPDTDTDTEQKDIVVLGAREPLEARLREAAGWQSDPSPNLFVTGPVEALIAAGAILETDVLPVIRSLAPRCTGRKNWKFFIPAIVQARDGRIAALTAVSTPSAARQKHAEPNQLSELIDYLGTGLADGGRPAV